MTAIRASQRLAHFSTTWNVCGLIFWVRDETRSFPAAMAVMTSLREFYYLNNRKSQRDFLSLDSLHFVSRIS